MHGAKTGEVWGRKNEIFDVKCFVSISRIVLPSYVGREHFFRKILKKAGLKIENAFKEVLVASKYRQKGVGYVKMSSKLCRIHFQSRPRRPPVAIIHTFVAFFHHTRSDNWRDHDWGSELRAENLDQMLGSMLGSIHGYEVEKWDFWSKMLCVHI